LAIDPQARAIHLWLARDRGRARIRLTDVATGHDIRLLDAALHGTTPKVETIVSTMNAEARPSLKGTAMSFGPAGAKDAT
jgi:hypothetical protein